MLQPEELFEVIIVDGGSTDETATVVNRYEKEFSFISEQDRGVYDAFNKGIAMSTGKYILFLGAGDRLKDGVLERVAELLPLDEVSFVYGNAYLMRHNVHVCGEFSRKAFMERNICQQAIFYERRIFELLGGFELKYKVYADWAFNMSCFAEPRIRKIYLEMVIADYEGWGISDTQDDLPFKQDFPRLIRHHVGIAEYIRYRVYLARVDFFLFRQSLRNSMRAAMAQPKSLLARRRRCDVEQEANLGE